MSLYSTTVDRPVAVTMVALGLIVFGILSFQLLPLNLMPSINYPRLTVRTEYPGSGPEEVEAEISQQVEKSLGTVRNLVRITSNSRAGISEIVIEFEWGTQMDDAMQEVREKVDRVFLPKEAKRPILLRYDPNLEPILRISLYGKSDLIRLRDYAEDVIQPSLETVKGVAAVKVRGGLEKQVEVALDEKKIKGLGISIAKISQRLKEENINLAGGRLKEGITYYWVRTLNEFQSIQEMGDLILQETDGNKIFLKDVATVQMGVKDPEIVSRMVQKQSIEISVYREAGANIVQVAQEVKFRLFGTPEQLDYLRKNPDKNIPPPTPLSGSKNKKNTSKKNTLSSRKKGKKATSPKSLKANPKKKGKGKAPQKGRFGKRFQQNKMKSFVLYQLPQDMEIKVIQDQSLFIKASVQEVMSSAVLGGLIAVLVLLIFLNNLWSTIIVGVSIPFSIVVTFGGMHFLGVSLNIMSLGGLALGIGMLVDNSIVVLENIFRLREEGLSAREAAIQGVEEVGGAVTASTLTTIAVFFPIVFVEGVAGQLLKDLSLTVVISLTSSLLVSLYFIPMLSALSFNPTQEESSTPFSFFSFSAGTHFKSNWAWWKESFSNRNGLGKLFFVFLFPFFFVSLLVLSIFQLFLDFFVISWKFLLVLLLLLFGFLWKVGRGLSLALWKPIQWTFDRLMIAFQASYSVFLRLALHQKELLILLCIALGFVSYSLLGQLKQEFMPKIYQGEFYLELIFPSGTPLETTSKRIAPLEQKLSKLQEVQDFFSVSGVEKTEVQNSEKGEHSSTIMVRLKKTKTLQKTEEKNLETIRNWLNDIPGLHYKVSFPSLFSLRTPIELLIQGNDLKKLQASSNQVMKQLQTIPFLRDIRSSAAGGLPEVQIHYQREKLFQYKLSVEVVAEAIRKKVLGDVATKYRLKEKRLDILVRVHRNQLKNIQELLNLAIRNTEGQMILLKQFAKVMIDEGPSEIIRISNQRSVVIQAELSGTSLGEVTGLIEGSLKTLQLPEGFTIHMGGQSEEMNQSIRSLLFALLLSIFLVYLVMASQFESFLSPLLILGTIPLAFVGVSFVLWFLNSPISVMVLIGMIILSGIVVNNAIVLVDAINRLIAEGRKPLQAIAEAGNMRMRPILMTTATTVLGLLPLALGLGEGSELRQPMAITIMAGLVVSTILTLVVIPVLVRMFLYRQKDDTIL